MQLFCFTFAGGTAAFFNQLESACASQIEFVKLEYPGHGVRHKENLCDTFQELSYDLYAQIREKYSEGEYALMGYSMGSIAALEALRYIIRMQELPDPKHIFLAAHPPKTMDELKEHGAEELDDYIKKRTVSFGGVPERLLNNNSFWRMYLPLYKADYLMIDRYDFEQLDFTSDIPATVFYSEADTPGAEMEQWKRYFTGSCELVEYTGGHFFINEHYEEAAALIKERLGCVAGDL